MSKKADKMTDEQRQGKKQGDAAYWQRYYPAHRDAILAKNAAWNRANPEKRRAQKRRWVEQHPGWEARYAREYRARRKERDRDALSQHASASSSAPDAAGGPTGGSITVGDSGYWYSPTDPATASPGGSR